MERLGIAGFDGGMLGVLEGIGQVPNVDALGRPRNDSTVPVNLLCIEGDMKSAGDGFQHEHAGGRVVDYSGMSAADKVALAIEGDEQIHSEIDLVTPARTDDPAGSEVRGQDEHAEAKVARALRARLWLIIVAD